MPWHGLPAPVEIRRAGGRATVVIHASPAPLVKAIFTMGFLLWGGDLILALRLVGASAGALAPFAWFAWLFLGGWILVGLALGHGALFLHEGTSELSRDDHAPVQMVFKTRWSIHRIHESLRFGDAKAIMAALAPPVARGHGSAPRVTGAPRGRPPSRPLATA